METRTVTIKDELLNFVKACTEYHPDETPEWYLEEIGISYEDLDATEHYEALDNAHDSFRDEYGSGADTDVVRSICEGARQLLKDLEDEIERLVDKYVD